MDENKANNKQVKEFAKESFEMRGSTSEAVQLNYNNLIVFLLRFSGLDFTSAHDLKLTDENCTDIDVLEEIISKANVTKDKFKTTKMYSIFESIVEEIYKK